MKLFVFAQKLSAFDTVIGQARFVLAVYQTLTLME
jgi:hypothetical protein